MLPSATPASMLVATAQTCPPKRSNSTAILLSGRRRLGYHGTMTRPCEKIALGLPVLLLAMVLTGEESASENPRAPLVLNESSNAGAGSPTEPSDDAKFIGVALKDRESLPDGCEVTKPPVRLTAGGISTVVGDFPCWGAYKAVSHPEPSKGEEARTYVAEQNVDLHVQPTKSREKKSPTDTRLVLETALWVAARDSNDPSDLKYYLVEFPGGIYRPVAYRRLKRLLAIDDAAFDRAHTKGTLTALEEYLRSFPFGRHFQEARQRANRIRKMFTLGGHFQECSACPEMIVVRPGSFMIGSPPSEEGRDSNEGPLQRVIINRPFMVGRYEVTRGQFRKFAQETGYSPSGCWDGTDKLPRWKKDRHWRQPGFEQTDTHPAVCVSWVDAQAYVSWLSTKTGAHYRLLTESEWEYAARSGTYWSRYWGHATSKACKYANAADRTARKHYGDWGNVHPCHDGQVHTAPVGRYEPNRWKLYDMLGNVWEWLKDCQKRTHDRRPSDGSAWLDGTCSRRAIRGGSWNNFPPELRSAVRSALSPETRTITVGFRVARSFASTDLANERVTPK